MPLIIHSNVRKKLVYVGMCADLFHHGHINVIEKALEYGDVIIGLLTDKAISSYRSPPLLNYDQRKRVLENIKGIKKVVPQITLDYVPNLRKLKPDYVVHGDDWKSGIQMAIREKVALTLQEWGGKLIEVPYTKGISSTKLRKERAKAGITPQDRKRQLKRLIELKPIVRVLEAHNGLSGIVVEQTQLVINGQIKEFDAIWESSLTDSASKGKPDIEIVDFTSRIQTIEQILEVTTKPLIVDGDTGGSVNHFAFMIKTLERLGISAVIIEDKFFPKQNSLLREAIHIQEEPKKFCQKIEAGKKAQITDDFMVIARIESLIAGKSIDDALKRARMYIDSGADGIMIHSKKEDPKEILDFCKRYGKLKYRIPLVVAPTSYNSITEDELKAANISIVIYANHLLRSSYAVMKKVAESILIEGRAKAVERLCFPIENLFEAVE